MSDLTPNHKPGEPLQPIDKDALNALAQKNIDNPEGGKRTVRTHTEADGQFRNYTKVRELEPVLVSEPPALYCPQPHRGCPGCPRSLHFRGYSGHCHSPWRDPDQD